MLQRLTLHVDIALEVTDAFANELAEQVGAARKGEAACIGAVNAAGKLADEVELDFLVLAVLGEQYADMLTRAIQQYSPPPTEAALLKTLISYGQTPEKLAAPSTAIPTNPKEIH